MKRLTLLSALVLMLADLTACQSRQQATKVRQDREHSSLVKENKRLKAEQRSKKAAQKNVQSTTSTSSSTATSGNQQETASSSNSGDLPPATDLHDFVNRYGVSPALYKVQHGMDQKAALDSTPDNMKTSGELQTQHQMDNQDN